MAGQQNRDHAHVGADVVPNLAAASRIEHAADKGLFAVEGVDPGDIPGRIHRETQRVPKQGATMLTGGEQP